MARVGFLRKQINAIKTQKVPRLEKARTLIAEAEAKRQLLLSQLDSVQAQISATRQAKAKELTDSLDGQINITITPQGDTSQYLRKLNDLCDRIATRERKIQNRDAQLANIVAKLPPRKLADALKRRGEIILDGGSRSTLQKLCGITANTQDVICCIAENISLLNTLETAGVPDVPTILVRRRGEAAYADLRAGLSPGEQSAAILTLALQTGSNLEFFSYLKSRTPTHHRRRDAPTCGNSAVFESTGARLPLKDPWLSVPRLRGV